MPILSKFEKFPREILDEIVLWVVELPVLGPPTALLPLLLLSRTISKSVSRKKNKHIYAFIFWRKFDVRAVVRRLGPAAGHAPVLTEALVRRFEGLNRLRHNAYPRGVHGDTLDGGLRVDMWMAYLMFLENDGGNAQQLLEYARIDRFAQDFVRPGGRLHDGAEENEGWTVDSEVNALGLWLFWFTDDKRVRSETQAEREEILGALGCIYAGSFKYATTYASLKYFRIPPTTAPPPLVPSPSIISLSTSPSLPPCLIPNYFGHDLILARPLLTSPALLACLVRLGGCIGGVPSGSTAPATRVEAIRVGWSGATGEDYTAFGNQGTRGVEWAGVRSESREHDWMRLMRCSNPWSKVAVQHRVFSPRMLNGVWEGRWLGVPPDFFRALLNSAQAHERIETPLEPPVFQGPMQFRLREHHQHVREDMLEFDDVSSDGVGMGALGAWLPRGTSTTERQGQLQVYNPKTRQKTAYQTSDSALDTLDEELPRAGGLYNEGVWDIILTAETDEAHGAAWGHDRFVGRVRDWDGLVVLVREERPGRGRWVFRGYVHGKQNLVGRWRETSTGVDVPGWEGAWGMVKKTI